MYIADDCKNGGKKLIEKEETREKRRFFYIDKEKQVFFKSTNGAENDF
jgi:hypothetical protein